MEIIDVDYTEVPDEPITETWYTCPSCGCLTPTGDVCVCGYHPQIETPAQPQVPAKKRRTSIAVVVLVIALLCSMLYSAVLAGTNSRLSNELSDAQDQIASGQQVIGNYKSTVLSLREYNRYLQDDVEQMCRVPSDYEFARSIYLARQNLSPLPRFKNFT